MLPWVIPAQPNMTPGPGPPSPEAAPAPPSAQLAPRTITDKTSLRISASCQVSTRLRRRRREESLWIPNGAEDAERLPVDHDQRASTRAADDEMPVAVGPQTEVPDLVRLVLPRHVDTDGGDVSRVERVDERSRGGRAVQRVRPPVCLGSCDGHALHRGLPRTL